MRKLNERLLLRITILITLILFFIIYCLFSLFSEATFFNIIISLIISTILYEAVGAIIWGVFGVEKEVKKDEYDRK